MTRSNLKSIVADRNNIYTLLLGLDVAKRSGEDGITNRMLKMVASSIDGPLTTLFQKLPTK
jgi:hypothetical protein